MLGSTSTPLLTLTLLLACLFARALAGEQEPVPALEEQEQEQLWGPTAYLYWRCQSPFLIEFSRDSGQTWKPSSICLEGTCCSKLATGPFCSKEACLLVAQEPGHGVGFDPVAGGSPKLPSFPG